VASANITVVVEEELIETFVPVNKTVAKVETFDFEESFSTVEYLFSTGEPITDPADIAIIRNAFPYPVPYITAVDSEGGVKIGFSRKLALREAFKNTTKRDRVAFMESDLIMMNQSFILSLLSSPADAEDSDEETREEFTTEGSFRFDEELFLKDDQQRNLQDKTEDAELEEQRSFNWTISDFDGESLTLQAYYSDTLVKGQTHRLQIKYNNT